MLSFFLRKVRKVKAYTANKSVLTNFLYTIVQTSFVSTDNLVGRFTIFSRLPSLVQNFLLAYISIEYRIYFPLYCAVEFS